VLAAFLAVVREVVREERNPKDDPLSSAILSAKGTSVRA